MNEIHLHKIHNYLHNIAYIFFLFYFVFGLFLQPIRMNSFSLGKHIAKVAKKTQKILWLSKRKRNKDRKNKDRKQSLLLTSRLDICMQSTKHWP